MTLHDQLKGGAQIFYINPARVTDPDLVVVEIDRLAHRGQIGEIVRHAARNLVLGYPRFFRHLRVLDAADLAVDLACEQIEREVPALLRPQAE